MEGDDFILLVIISLHNGRKRTQGKAVDTSGRLSTGMNVGMNSNSNEFEGLESRAALDPILPSNGTNRTHLPWLLSTSYSPQHATTATCRG